MTDSLVRTIHTSVTIAGQEIPVYSWKIKLSSQGSMGTAEAETSLLLLRSTGADVIEASQDPAGASFTISAGYDGNMQLLFSGVLDECEFDPLSDTYSLQGRDQAAALNDGRQTVAGMNYRNQTVGQMVKQIAKRAGIEADVVDPGIPAGPKMNGETSYNPHPQTFWSMLQTMAKDTNCECYHDTAKGTLYFGPEKDQGTIEVNVGAFPGTNARNPVKMLKFKYNPRNNTNIDVKVLSQNTQSTELVNSSATAKAQKLSHGRRSSSSLVGSNSKVKYPSKSGGSVKGVKQTYYIRDTGTDPEVAARKAQAKADDLAKRQVIASCEIEGLPDLKIHSHINFIETNIDLGGFDALDFNVAEVEHSYTMDQGFMSSFRALALVS